jgi:hypothetical protein
MPKTVIETNDRAFGPLRAITQETGEAFIRTVLTAAEAKGWVCAIAVAGVPDPSLGVAEQIRLAGVAGMRGTPADIVETFNILAEAAIRAAACGGDAEAALALAAEIAGAVHHTARRAAAKTIAEAAGMPESAVDAILRAAEQATARARKDGTTPPGDV